MAAGRKENRRKTEPRHIRLYHTITGSDAWRDLSGNAIKVLIALVRFDRGSDNGEIFMSIRTAADETGLSENTACRALKELEDHGFIAAMERGYFQQKRGPATRWRYTWQPAKGIGPTRDFEKWGRDQNKSRAQNLRSTGAKIAIAEPAKPATVAKIATATTENSHFSEPATTSKIATQVVLPEGVGDRDISALLSALSTFETAIGRAPSNLDLTSTQAELYRLHEALIGIDDDAAARALALYENCWTLISRRHSGAVNGDARAPASPAN